MNSMKKNNTKVNLLYQFSYRLLTVFTPLITSPYLSRVLGVRNLGVYSATYAYANYFILISMLGVEAYGSRAIALCNDTEEISRTFSNIYAVQIASSFISILIYFGSVFLFSGDRMVVALIQGVWIIAASLDINWFFFGKQQFKITVSRNIVIKFLTIICIFVFVNDKTDLLKYIAIMSGGALLSQIIMWIVLLKTINIAKPSIQEFSKHVLPILKLFIPVAAMSIYHVMDKTMVDVFSDEINGGCYYNTDRLINIPLGIITAFGTVMLPKMSKLIKDDNQQSNFITTLVKSSELTICLISAIAFGMGSIAKEFVPMFFGPGYELCIVLIRCFVPIIIIKALSDFLRQQYLIPNKDDNIYIVAVCSGAAVNLFANIALISHFGALGAVFGTLIAEFIVLIIELYSVKGEINFINIFFPNKIYIIFGLVMYIFVILISRFNINNSILKVGMMIVGGGLSYTLMCIIYWLCNKRSMFHSYVCKIIKREDKQK